MQRFLVISAFTVEVFLWSVRTDCEEETPEGKVQWCKLVNKYKNFVMFQDEISELSALRQVFQQLIVLCT